MRSDEIRDKKNKDMEREKGFEPSTLALARRCSTTELFPLSEVATQVREQDSTELTMHCQAIYIQKRITTCLLPKPLQGQKCYNLVTSSSLQKSPSTY